MASSPVRLCAPQSDEDLSFVTRLPPEVAFARAVAHLMGKPAFAQAPFGHIARALAGQVNRGHYGFVLRGPAIEGFVGWARATEPHAEAWLDDTRALSQADAMAGDCLVLNFWQADAPEVSRVIVARLGHLMPDIRRVYAKRHYPDGHIRRLRLDLPARTPRPD